MSQTHGCLGAPRQLSCMVTTLLLKIMKLTERFTNYGNGFIIPREYRLKPAAEKGTYSTISQDTCAQYPEEQYKQRLILPKLMCQHV